jgi:cytochrome oxidase Cu insertion factor (SCO1/SenC/PrrC family)
MTSARVRGAWPRSTSIITVVLGIALPCGCRVERDVPSPSVSSLETAPDRTPPEQGKTCCKTDETPAAGSTSAPVFAPGKPRPIVVPDVKLVDQDGKEVRFYHDLVKGKVVAINFVFTSCKAACPLLGAGFSKLQTRLGDRLGKDCSLISVSVDPAVDRPERLQEWAAQFGARPGWTLVTASKTGKDQLDTLLKALQVYSPEKTDHSQSVLVVDGNSLEGWSSQRTAGTDELVAMIDAALQIRGSRNYFTDTTLVDQDGRRLRFYTDLIQGKVVVIHPFFSSCTGSCTVMASALSKLQDRLGDRLGKEVVLLSLTVDPATDQVQRLAEHARKLGTRPGWHLLTGEKDDLEQVERRLGQFVEQREAHSTVIVVGNESSGLWLKHLDPRDSDGLIAKVEQALADGQSAPPLKQ